MHRYILHNDKIYEAASQVLSPGQVGLLAGWGVFSTLHVAGGVLFAWERHWARMTKDAALFSAWTPAIVNDQFSEVSAFLDYVFWMDGHSETLLTAPLIGWTPHGRAYACGFSVATYGAQQSTDCIPE